MKKELLNTVSQVNREQPYLQRKTHCDRNKVSKELSQIRQVDRKKILPRR